MAAIQVTVQEYALFLDATGVRYTRFAEVVQEMGGEGVVAKRLNSVYQPGKRSGAWAKMRLNVGQEFVIGGFTSGSNGIDAVVVGFCS